MSVKPFGLSVKALLHDDAGRYLVIQRHRESSFWPAQWDLPGGKLDPGESFDQALLREAKEETGFEIELERYVGGIEWELPHVRVVFLVMQARIVNGGVDISSEHEGWRWVEFKELGNLPLIEPLAKVLLGIGGESAVMRGN